MVGARLKIGQLEGINRFSFVSAVPLLVGGGFVQQRRGRNSGSLDFSPPLGCEEWGHL